MNQFDAPRLSRQSPSARGLTTYSATDIQAVIMGRDLNGNDILHPLGDIQTLSFSCHTDKSPVRVLGCKNPRAHTDGFRTIAGTLIFATFDQRPLYGLAPQQEIDLSRSFNEKPKIASAYQQVPSDALPPFDVILTFSNEYGQSSVMYILGVTLVDEGETLSVNDVYIEHTMQYLARDISLLRKEGEAWRRGEVTTASIFTNASRLHRAAATGANLL